MKNKRNQYNLDKIELPILKQIFEDISVINYFIKDGNTGITKSAFYQLKKYLIRYVIRLIKGNKYKKDEDIRYEYDGLDKQIIVNDGFTTEHYLAKIIFHINGITYRYHQGLNRGLEKLLKVEINDFNKAGEYVREPNNYKYETPEELQKRYIRLVDTLASLEWCIYRRLDHYGCIEAIMKRYNLSDYYQEVIDHRCYVGFEINGHRTEGRVLKDFRQKTTSIMKELLGEEYKLNYNIK